MRNILKKGIVTIMATATLCVGTLTVLADKPEETVIETTETEAPVNKQERKSALRSKALLSAPARRA